jgi:hypothetical protein
MSSATPVHSAKFATLNSSLIGRWPGRIARAIPAPRAWPINRSSGAAKIRPRTRAISLSENECVCSRTSTSMMNFSATKNSSASDHQLSVTGAANGRTLGRIVNQTRTPTAHRPPMTSVISVDAPSLAYAQADCRKRRRSGCRCRSSARGDVLLIEVTDPSPNRTRIERSSLSPSSWILSSSSQSSWIQSSSIPSSLSPSS